MYAASIKNFRLISHNCTRVQHDERTQLLRLLSRCLLKMSDLSGAIKASSSAIHLFPLRGDLWHDVAMLLRASTRDIYRSLTSADILALFSIHDAYASLQTSDSRFICHPHDVCDAIRASYTCNAVASIWRWAHISPRSGARSVCSVSSRWPMQQRRCKVPSRSPYLQFADPAL